VADKGGGVGGVGGERIFTLLGEGQFLKQTVHMRRDLLIKHSKLPWAADSVMVGVGG